MEIKFVDNDNFLINVINIIIMLILKKKNH